MMVFWLHGKRIALHGELFLTRVPRFVQEGTRARLSWLVDPVDGACNFAVAQGNCPELSTALAANIIPCSCSTSAVLKKIRNFCLEITI